MGITPISGGSNNMTSPLGDNGIKLLEKQKQLLQDEILKVKESKMDEKKKQEKIKSLQEQMQQIDAEIQQRRSEKLNKSQNVNQDTGSKRNAGSIEDNSDLAGLNQIALASNTYSKAKIINGVKSAMTGKSKILKQEIKLDEGRGFDPKWKRQELQEAESKQRELGEKVGETLQTAQKDLKEASKTENKDENNVESDIQRVDANNNENDQAIPVDNDSGQKVKRKAKKQHTSVDIRI